MLKDEHYTATFVSSLFSDGGHSSSAVSKLRGWFCTRLLARVVYLSVHAHQIVTSLLMKCASLA